MLCGSLSFAFMAIFASQTPAIKTAFDSAFDEIIRVEPMTFEEARELLDLRVTGVPLPFLALCHVLAGGVPRELIRASQSLYQEAKGFSERYGQPRYGIETFIAGARRTLAHLVSGHLFGRPTWPGLSSPTVLSGPRRVRL